jgi:hypothetical protein
MAKVTLPQPITLSANIISWLVVSPGSPDFNGAWQISHLGDSGLLKPGIQPWIIGDGEWPAARVGGMRLETLGPVNQIAQNNPLSGADAGAVRRVNIFFKPRSRFPNSLYPGSWDTDRRKRCVILR